MWEEAQEKIIYTNGKDKEGRPIMVFKKRGTLHDPAMQLRLFVFMLEEAIRRMDHGIYQFVLILDMQELASANSPPLPSTLELLRTLSGHYPERMKIAFFTHQPFVFTGTGCDAKHSAIQLGVSVPGPATAEQTQLSR